MSATLSIEFSDSRTLNAVNSSLLPDNIDFPEGMKFTQRKNGKELEITVDMYGSDRSIETLISTLDELVSHIHSAISTLQVVESLND